MILQLHLGNLPFTHAHADGRVTNHMMHCWDYYWVEYNPVTIGKSGAYVMHTRIRQTWRYRAPAGETLRRVPVKDG